jgi:hypothetical protein
MKKPANQKKGVVKGMPSAVLLSIAIHAALFFLAGALVVFTVVKKKEMEFEPPKAVERPKMKLKKPKVRIKKSSRPKSATRIVSKANRASMPNIELPEMSGMGDGLGDGLGGFDLMPDLEEISLFGGGRSIGNDFVGTFYDFNRDHSGRKIPMDPDKMRDVMLDFVQDGWRSSVFAPYYRSPRKLYATCFAIPPVHSTRAPSAFGEYNTPGYCWAAHYKGQLVYPEDITFRFWGQGDDFMLVRVGGKLVLQACWPDTAESYFLHLWSSGILPSGITIRWSATGSRSRAVKPLTWRCSSAKPRAACSARCSWLKSRARNIPGIRSSTAPHCRSSRRKSLRLIWRMPSISPSTPAMQP